MDKYDFFALEKAKIVLGKAPAGFGKTSRMKYILNKKEVVWISLDEGCNQETIFFERWLRALKRKMNQGAVNSVVGNQMDDSINEGLHEEDADFYSFVNQYVEGTMKLELVRQEVRKRLEQLLARKQEKLVMVFDNIQCMHNKKCLSVIETLIEHYAGMQYIFLGREEPKFLIRYIISKSCIVLEKEKFYLSRQETCAYFQQQLNCSEQDANQYVEMYMRYFHGWPIGVNEVVKFLGMGYGGDSNFEEYFLNSWLSRYIEYAFFEKIPREELYQLKILALLLECDEELWGYICQQNLGDHTAKKMLNKHFFIYEEKGMVKCIPAFRLILQNQTEHNELEEMVNLVAQYYFARKKYTQLNDLLFRFKSKEIMEDYLSKCFTVFKENDMIPSYVEGLLYLLETGEELQGTVLRYMAEVVSLIGAKKEMDERERTLYLDIIMYNENPKEYKASLLNFFHEYLNTIRDTKRIYITCFGQFKVEVMGEQSELKWRTKKGCELFAYLYHMQGVPITRKVLLNILWPNEIQKNAVTMFHNMIYNIRKELMKYGLEEVIQYKDKMYSLNMKWIESDYDVRKTLIEKSDQIEYLLEQEHLVKSYPGQYLENIDNNWTIELKEFYDKKYIVSCMRLADYYIERKQYENALIYLRNILQVDNLKEIAIGKVLLCYGSIGEKKLLQQEYLAFEHLLQKELNVEPCEYVKQMYHKALKI